MGWGKPYLDSSVRLVHLAEIDDKDFENGSARPDGIPQFIYLSLLPVSAEC